MSLISKDQTIAVFGSSGMVGSAICRALKKKNYSNIYAPKREDLNLIDSSLVDYWFKKNKPEIVILAAAKVGGILANQKYPTAFLLENMKIQNNVIESSFKNNVKKFLFLGSSCIYPKYSAQPIIEEELLSGSLETSNQWYAIAKISGIKLCQALYIEHNFNAICLMPTNLYGPGDNYHDLNSHVIPALIKRFNEAIINGKNIVTCWGSGKPLREFLHVDDLAEASIFALEKWDLNKNDAPKDIYGNTLTFLNVGTGKDITIYEIANLIAKHTGFKGEIIWDKTKPDGTPKKQLNVNRILNLGWSPKIKLEVGIRDTIFDYKSKFLN